MARARRTFYTARRRTVKWSPHLIEERLAITANSESFGSYQLLAKNSSDSSTPTPSVIKVKNFRVSVDTLLGSSSFSSSLQTFNVYVIFIPEGVTITQDTPKQHPEWLLGWKSVNEITHQQRDTTVITSRLARNLNSGDSVYVLFTGSQGPNVSQTINVNIVASYVTRAN